MVGRSAQELEQRAGLGAGGQGLDDSVVGLAEKVGVVREGFVDRGNDAVRLVRMARDEEVEARQVHLRRHRAAPGDKVEEFEGHVEGRGVLLGDGLGLDLGEDGRQAGGLVGRELDVVRQAAGQALGGLGDFASGDQEFSELDGVVDGPGSLLKAQTGHLVGLVGVVQALADDPLPGAGQVGERGDQNASCQERLGFGGFVLCDEHARQGDEHRGRLGALGDACAEPVLPAGGQFGLAGCGTLPDGHEEAEHLRVFIAVGEHGEELCLGLGPEGAGGQVLGVDPLDGVAGSDGLAERTRGRCELVLVNQGAAGGVEHQERRVGTFVEAVAGDRGVQVALSLNGLVATHGQVRRRSAGRSPWRCLRCR